MPLGSPCSAHDTGQHAFSQFVSSDRNSKLMFWHLLPAPVTGGLQWRLLPLSAEDWVDKKLFFDAKSEMVKPHGVELNEEEKSTREKILKQVFRKRMGLLTVRTRLLFGARWSPEFPVIAPQNAGHERESFPSLGHNSWSEAAFSNAPQAGNVSAAATTLRWSYSCLGHMSWPERAFSNAFSIGNENETEM